MNITKRFIKIQVEVARIEQGETINRTLKEYEGLQVAFNIEKRASSLCNNATIQITNLNREHIEYLTTINAISPANEGLRKIIRVFAGYEDNWGLIFEGDITSALPTPPPDITLQCTCLSGYYNKLFNYKAEFQGVVKVRDIITQIAKDLNLTLIWQLKEDKTLDGFSYQGSLGDIIETLNKLGKFSVFEEDGKLYVCDKENGKNPQQVTWNYSKENGMIGIPQPDMYGVKFKVLLNPGIHCYDSVNLVSSQIPAANGEYYIYKINHVGESRGTSFYSELECRTYDNN